MDKDNDAPTYGDMIHQLLVQLDPANPAAYADTMDAIAKIANTAAADARDGVAGMLRFTAGTAG
ncbi:hypothetical protein ABMY26_06380 (plasmid) [Azospirillum sp. HJ39]|uniref:hypothetical protein n=1 Tax=Azospirillum sp. HJ39 TaxID=3159496 RepID=UPI003556D24D